MQSRVILGNFSGMCSDIYQLPVTRKTCHSRSQASAQQDSHSQREPLIQAGLGWAALLCSAPCGSHSPGKKPVLLYSAHEDGQKWRGVGTCECFPLGLELAHSQLHPTQLAKATHRADSKIYGQRV